MLPPLLDEHLGPLQGVEDLPIRQFIPQRPLKEPLLPFSQALLNSMNSVRTSSQAGHYRTLFAQNAGPLSERRWPGQPRGEEQISQGRQHIIRRQLRSHHDRQRLPCALIQDRAQSKRLPVVGAIGHDVIGPHVVLLYPWTNFRGHGQSQPQRATGPTRTALRDLRDPG